MTDQSALIAEIQGLLAADRREELREMLRARASEDPSDAFVRLYYGVVLSMDAVTREEAIDEIRAAIDLKPDVPNNLAMAASRMFLSESSTPPRSMCVGRAS